MKSMPGRFVLAGATLALLGCGALLRAAPRETAQTPAAAGRDYPVKPVPFTAVHLDDVFWAPRIEVNRTVTIPFAFGQCERSGRMGNFVRAAAALRGETLTDRTIPPRLARSSSYMEMGELYSIFVIPFSRASQRLPWKSS